MAFDLIRRAGEHLSRPQADHEVADAAGVPAGADGHTADQDDGAAWVDPPVVALRQPLPRPQPSASPAGRSSRSISIDLARLRRAGMVTPDGEGSRTIVEEFRLVKRPLLVKALDPARNPRNRLIVVTSAHPGEGKSYVAHNLALSIAGESDTHVLLVDADLRHPATPQRFGFTAEHGLTDLLAEDSLDPADVLLHTDIGKLSILPAGRHHPRSTELLASPRMAKLMAEIAQRYADRVVILDAPPVLTSSDTSALAMHVGQIVLVVEADRTGRRAIEDSLALLECCPDISFVINKGRNNPTIGALKTA